MPFQLLPLILVFLPLASTTPVVINTPLGPIRGNILDVNGKRIYEFAGIPYSIPRIKQDRFKPAQVWTKRFSTTFDATKYGASCPQQPQTLFPIEPNQNEDCLFLNIWVPSSVLNGENAPVMLGIHGGSFLIGSGNDYNGTNIAAQGVVLVSINYRLGPLGYLASPELYEENSKMGYPSFGGANGLNDQIVALKWVHKYIDSFGGDVTRITVFGESAGGLAVCDLLVSPVAKNLFHNAIIQSGSCTGPWGPSSLAKGLKVSVAAMHALNMTTIQQLRDFPDGNTLNQMLVTAVNWGLCVSADTYVLPDLPSKLYEQTISRGGTNNAQKVIIGGNSQDGVAGWPYFESTQPKDGPALVEVLESGGLTTTDALKFVTKYYPAHEYQNNFTIAWYAMNGDLCVVCPAIEDARLIRLTGSTPYLYVFAGPYSPHEVPHEGELPYLFANDSMVTLDFVRMKWSDSMSNKLMSAWTNMAKEGTPSFSSCRECDTISWPPFMNAEGAGIVFDGQHTTYENFAASFRNGACQAWWAMTNSTQRTKLCFS